MAITFQCPHCDHDLRVRDELAGRKARCYCGAAIAIPGQRVEADGNGKASPKPKPAKGKVNPIPNEGPEPAFFSHPSARSRKPPMERVDPTRSW